MQPQQQKLNALQEIKLREAARVFDEKYGNTAAGGLPAPGAPEHPRAVGGANLAAPLAPLAPPVAGAAAAPAASAAPKVFIKDPEQTHCLINLFNAQRRCGKSELPRVRIVGLFSKHDAAKKDSLISRVKLEVKDSDLESAQTKGFILVGSSEEHQRDKKYCLDKISKNIELHKQKQVLSKEEFNNHRTTNGLVAGNNAGNASNAGAEQKPTAVVTPAPATSIEPSALLTQSTVSAWPRALELRQQQFAVITILPDYLYEAKQSPCLEPSIAIFAAFGDLSDAQNYIRNTLAQQLESCYSLDTVEMYESFAVHGITNSLLSKVLPIEYRNPEHNLIMQRQRQEQIEADQKKVELEQGVKKDV